MTRLIVTLVASVGAYMGLAEIWNGSKDVLFRFEGFPFSYRFLAAVLAAGMALSIGK